MREGTVLLHGKPVGLISETEDGFRFAYDTAYVQPGAQPVSLTLPVRADPYIADRLFPFFTGLLSEGPFALMQCRMLRIDERDLFGRLLATCRDTIGAVTVEPR